MFFAQWNDPSEFWLFVFIGKRSTENAFACLLVMFSEILFPSKLYLTAGLHGAVMQVIVDDKEYLDYEISKVLSRYTPKDILKRFGPPGQSSTNTKIKEYVVIMKGKLIRLCKKFMKSLIQKIYCFPHRYRFRLFNTFRKLTDCFLLERYTFWWHIIRNDDWILCHKNKVNNSFLLYRFRFLFGL